MALAALLLIFCQVFQALWGLFPVGTEHLNSAYGNALLQVSQFISFSPKSLRFIMFLPQ